MMESSCLGQLRDFFYNNNTAERPKAAGGMANSVRQLIVADKKG